MSSYCILPFLDSSERLSIRKVFKNKGRYDKCKFLSDRFKSIYQYYLDDNLQTGVNEPSINLILDSCHDMFQVVSKQCLDYVNILIKKEKISFGKAMRLYNELLLAAQKEIYQMSDYRTRGGNNNIRRQVELFLEQDKAISKIIFHTVELNGESIKVPIKKSDFVGKRIKVYRLIKGVSQSDLDFYGYSRRSIKYRAKILYNLISVQGGKARIYPTVNLGPDYGYQYIRVTSSSITYPIFPREHSPDDISIDIDLNDPNVMRKLEYIVASSLIYTSGAGPSGVSSLRDFLFLVKPIGEQGNPMEDKLICGFNFRNLFLSKHIFSSDNPYQTKDETTFYIPINDIEFDILNSNTFLRASQLWRTNNKLILLSIKSKDDFTTHFDINVFF